MTHRERVLAALSREETDRPPMDLGGTRDSSIVLEGYDRLKAHLGVETENRLCDRMMRVVHVDEEVSQKLDLDFRSVFPGAATRGCAEELGPDTFRDVWGVERVHPLGSYYYDQVSFPLSGEITTSEILNYPWPDPDDPGYTAPLRERVNWIRTQTDCAAILTVPAPFVHISQYLRGFEDWYVDMALEPKRLEMLFDAVQDITSQIARRELEAVGSDVDIVICADDLGAQNALQFSREAYLKYIKPRHEKYFKLIHEMSPAKLLFHTCGSVVSIIDDLIEIGVDILNPVQVAAEGMDPKTLKERFGEKLCFWGAVDTQHLLPHGTPEEVKATVEKLTAELGAGGGYVISAVHNIQPDVPVENILAMLG